MIRVSDVDFEEVDRFQMGIRFFFNEDQVDAVPPTSIEGAHWILTIHGEIKAITL